MGMHYTRRKWFKELRKTQKNRCFYCNVKMVEYKAIGISCNAITVDHFFPKSYGFNIEGNRVLACHSCNTGSNSLLPDREECLRFAQFYKKHNLQTQIDFKEFLEHQKVIDWFNKYFGFSTTKRNRDDCRIAD